MTAIEELTVEEFTDECRAFLDAHAEAEGRRAAVRVGRGRRRPSPPSRRWTRPRRHGSWPRPRSGGPPVTTPGSAGSPARPSSAAGGCPRATAACYDSVEAGTRRRPASFFGIGLGMVAPTILAHATDAVKQAYLPGHVPRRRRRLPAVQRARCGLRPRGSPDQGRARRRRVGRSRVRRSGRPARSTATSARSSAAPIPSQPKHRGLTGFVVDMRGARRRGAAAASDDRWRVVQRGLLQRGPRARRPPPRRRQRRVDGRAHDADERAGLDRRRQRRRARHRQLRAPHRDAPATSGSTRTVCCGTS